MSSSYPPDRLIQRRRFIASSLAASAAALAKPLHAATAPAPTQTAPSSAPAAPLYYEVRRYDLLTGPQLALTDAYLANALIPAVNRLGIGPVGAFKIDIGGPMPTLYVLLPSPSLDLLANLNTALAKNPAYVQAAQPFNAAPAATPGFRRIDSSLLSAFHQIAYPPVSPGAPKRIFQLRTYESPTLEAHNKKVAMFQGGEIDIFLSVGFKPVFFGRNLIGQNLPALTYMLTFSNMAELETKWSAFSSAPAWRKLVTTPGNSDDFLISNITNLILSPRPYSQI